MPDISSKDLMKSMFETFKTVFADLEKNEKIGKEDINLRKLAYLDDSEALLIWQAMLSTFIENPGKIAFRPAINLGVIPSNTTMKEFREYIEEKKLSIPNPYFTNVQNIKNKNMKGICAVGYHGSTVFGEWTNAFVAQGTEEELKNMYIEFSVFISLLARILRLVTSDRLYSYYRKINSTNSKDLFCSFVLDENLNDGIKLDLINDVSNGNRFTIKYSQKFVNEILLKFKDKEQIKFPDSTTFENMIEKMKVLDRYTESYYDFVVQNNNAINEEIKNILKLKHDGNANLVTPKDITDFLAMLQFLVAFSVIHDFKEFHFYYPTGIKKENYDYELLETPEVFFMFFNKVEENDLLFLNDAYKEFIKFYNIIVNDLIDDIRIKFNEYRSDQDDQSQDTDNKKSEAKNVSIPHATNYPFIKQLRDQLLDNTLLTNHVLASGIMAKEFVNETKIEQNDVQYSFLLSNRENIELIQRELGRNPPLDLSFNEEEIKFSYDDKTSILQKQKVEYLTVGLERKLTGKKIMQLEPRNLYKAIGLLKGHYTLINKPSRIIALIPDNKKNSTVKLFSILDLQLSELKLIEQQSNSVEVLKRITEKYCSNKKDEKNENQKNDKTREIWGLSVSKDGSHVIYQGEIFSSYNGHKLAWEQPIPLHKVLKSTIIREIGVDKEIQMYDEVLEVIVNVIEKISNSHLYGATIILGKIPQLEKFTSNSFLITPFIDKSINPGTDKMLLQKYREDLFDLSIMDGATLIDTKMWQSRGRVVLQPMQPPDFKKPFHFSLKEIGDLLDPEWVGATKYYSMGTRHLSALGMALCTNNSLIFVISSTGTITTFYKGKGSKVRGYTLEELYKKYLAHNQ